MVSSKAVDVGKRAAESETLFQAGPQKDPTRDVHVPDVPFELEVVRWPDVRAPLIRSRASDECIESSPPGKSIFLEIALAFRLQSVMLQCGTTANNQRKISIVLASNFHIQIRSDKEF